MPFDQQEVENVLEKNGFTKSKTTKKIGEFRSSLNGKYIYLRHKNLPNQIRLVVDPREPKELFRDINGVVEASKFEHGSNMTQFPKRKNTGIDQIHFGIAHNISSIDALVDFATAFHKLPSITSVKMDIVEDGNGSNKIAHWQSALLAVVGQMDDEYSHKPGEDVDVIAKRRVGQGPFRNLLEAVYGSACWVSGIRIEKLLIASHIVPWSKSSPVEKTDRDNGLLLSVSWDAVFDKGFVSFDDNGTLMCSEMLDAESAWLLGIATEAKLPPEMLTEGRKKYLSWHREHVFENWKKSPGL